MAEAIGLRFLPPFRMEGVMGEQMRVVMFMRFSAKLSSSCGHFESYKLGVLNICTP